MDNMNSPGQASPVGTSSLVSTSDYTQALNYSQALFSRYPGMVFTLQVFDIPSFGKDGKKYLDKACGFFNEPIALATAAVQYSGRASGIYISLNPLNPDLLARCFNRLERKPAFSWPTVADVLGCRQILIDVDPIRLSDISSTDEELKAAGETAYQIAKDLHAQGWPTPDLGCSGNGAFLRYAVDLPVSECEEGGLVQRTLQVLAQKYDSPKVHVDCVNFNAMRISKFPGTLAMKGDSIPGHRPHRLCSTYMWASAEVPHAALCALHPAGAGGAPMEGSTATAEQVTQATPTPTPSPTKSTKAKQKEVEKNRRQYVLLEGTTRIESKDGVSDLATFHSDSDEFDRTKIFCPFVERDAKSQLGEAWVQRYKNLTHVHCSRDSHTHGQGNYRPGSQAMPEGADSNVYAGLKVSDKGKVLPIFENVVKILGTDPRWTGRLWFDEYRLQIRYSKAQDSNSTTIQDEDEIGIRLWLANVYGMDARAQDVSAAIVHVARDNGRDPLLEELDAMPEWDGEDRIPELTHRVLGVPVEGRMARGHETMVRRWMIGGISRAYQPRYYPEGVKMDNVLILQCETQGNKKSSVFEALASPRWFSDASPPLDKAGDALLTLRGKWIHEWGELEAIRGREATTYKDFIARKVDRGRLSYGRHVVEAPRRCVLAGTTNKSLFLDDPTGSRRFWIIPVPTDHEIDVAWVVKNRDQLWAQAIAFFHRYRAGDHACRWWMERAEEDAVREMNSEFEEVDPWCTPLQFWLDATGNLYHMTGFGITDAAPGVGLMATKLDLGISKRIARCLRKLGCTWRHTAKGNRWFPPSAPA